MGWAGWTDADLQTHPSRTTSRTYNNCLCVCVCVLEEDLTFGSESKNGSDTSDIFDLADLHVAMAQKENHINHPNR